MTSTSNNGGVPAWVRGALRADRAFTRIHHLESSTLERLMCLFLDPSRRAAVTTAAYSAQQQYLPGSRLHEQGLLAWERAALRTAPFPAAGHLLLGAAGGGRELRTLCELGYSVTAFEPVATLAAAAGSVAAGFADAEVIEASYDDLVGEVAGAVTPFAGRLDRHIDGVILGFGSFTHVVDEAERIALLRALRLVAPAAPVLLSYNARDPGSIVNGSGPRTQRVRTLLGRAGVRTHDIPPGLGFTSFYGFRYSLADGELDRLAATTGYRVALASVRDFPHAMLAPVP